MKGVEGVEMSRIERGVVGSNRGTRYLMRSNPSRGSMGSPRKALDVALQREKPCDDLIKFFYNRTEGLDMH